MGECIVSNEEEKLNCEKEYINEWMDWSGAIRKERRKINGILSI